MLILSQSGIDLAKILKELLTGSGVVAIKNVYSIDQILEVREIVNKFADNQGQKESHFNAEAKSANTIHLKFGFIFISTDASARLLFV